MIITVITGATRIVKRRLKKTLEAIIRKRSTGSLQRTSTLGNITHNTESTAV